MPHPVCARVKPAQTYRFGEMEHHRGFGPNFGPVTRKDLLPCLQRHGASHVKGGRTRAGWDVECLCAVWIRSRPFG